MSSAIQTIERAVVALNTQEQGADPTLYSNEFGLVGVKAIDLIATVTAESGTSTKLDLTLQGYNEQAAAWYDIVSFTQITAAGPFRKAFLEADGILPPRLRLKRVVSGGTVVASVADVDPAGANNRMDWTGKGAWVAGSGNGKTVEYRSANPAGSGALSVAVDPDNANNILVKLATSTDGVAATVNVDPAGTQNALDWTAKVKGVAMNGKTITYTNPGTPSAALSMTMNPTTFAISVSLATDAGTKGTKNVDPTGSNNAVTYTEAVPGYMVSIAYTLALTASAPLSAAETSAGVIVATLPTDAGVKASKDIGPTGGQFTLRSKSVGTAGNAGTITIVALTTDHPVTTAALATVDDITISLGKDAYGTIVGDGNAVMAALLGNPDIAAAYEIVLISGADLTKVWATATVVSFAGGLAPALVAASATANLVRAAIDALGKTTSANTGGDTGAGAVAAISAQAFSGSAAPAITTIASAIDALAAATPAIDAVYAVANHAGNDGTGVVTAMSAQTLASGADASITSTAAEVKAASDAVPAVFALIVPTNHSGNDGTGVVTVMAPVALAGGADRSYAYSVNAVVQTY